MYIFSFFKSLFKPKHIPPAIYFLANAALIFVLFALLPFKIYPDNKLNQIFLGLIGLGINFVFIFLSLTPLGEAFWRLTNAIKKKPEEALAQQWLVANQVFEEVKATAICADRHVSKKVKLYYSRTDELNAYALGHRTVIITRGMLGIHPDYLKGVLAHEFGHIAHGDGDLKLGINVSNFILSIFVFFVSLIANTVIAMFEESDSCLAVVITLAARILLNIIILGLFQLWTLLGVVLVNWSSRRDEYSADAFANKLGYGESLAMFLDALDGDTPRMNKFSLMFQTHPDTVDRLAKLGY